MLLYRTQNWATLSGRHFFTDADCVVLSHGIHGQSSYGHPWTGIPQMTPDLALIFPYFRPFCKTAAS
jgi:hypothetical protein